jgi:hypothetical protein
MAGWLNQRLILVEQRVEGLDVRIARDQRLQLRAEALGRAVAHEDTLVHALVDHLHGILRRVIDHMHHRVVEDDHHVGHLLP